MSGYRLSKHSKGQLVGLHPEIGFLMSEAIKVAPVDFIVFDGVRSEEEQDALVARGMSKTNDSYHLYGLAADAVPWVDGRPTWGEDYFEPLNAMFKTIIKAHGLAIQNGFDLWGWDLAHWQMSGFKTSWDIRALDTDVCW